MVGNGSCRFLFHRCYSRARGTWLRCGPSPVLSTRSCIHDCPRPSRRIRARSLTASLGRAACCFSYCDSTRVACPESYRRNLPATCWDSLCVLALQELRFWQGRGCLVCLCSSQPGRCCREDLWSLRP